MIIKYGDIIKLFYFYFLLFWEIWGNRKILFSNLCVVRRYVVFNYLDVVLNVIF